MNCDKVFDVLTRGPFPTGNSGDAAVERHLAACHECRDLAEALQPAVNLFHERLAVAETAPLPGYRGVYSDSSKECLPAALWAALDDDAPATNTAPAPLRQVAGGRGARQIVLALSAAAAASLAMFGAFWLAPPVWSNGSIDGGAGGEMRAVRFQPTELGREWLAALALPKCCFEAGLAALPAEISPKNPPKLHDCCLKCHAAANSARPSLDATAALDRTCHACHDY